MANYTYETHDMPNPLLPFIFHRDTVVSQTTFLPNWHENIELIYCIEGEGLAVINSNHINIEQGSLLVINSGDIHYMVLLIHNFVNKKATPLASFCS